MSCPRCIFSRLLFSLISLTNAFRFGGPELTQQLSRNPILKCISARNNLDCSTREDQFCCNLLRSRTDRVRSPRLGSVSGSSPRQFPHFPAKDDVRHQQSIDYDDIITKDSGPVSPVKEFPTFQVDTSFSFEGDGNRAAAKKEAPRIEENVIDVDADAGAGKTSAGSGEEPADREKCQSLNVPCFALPSHPCCGSDKAEIVVGSKKVEKLFDFSKIGLQTPAPDPVKVEPTKTDDVKPDEVVPDKCASVICRAYPRNPCCKNYPKPSGFFRFPVPVRQTPPPRKVFTVPPTEEATTEEAFPNFETDLSELVSQTPQLKVPESDYEEEEDLDRIENSKPTETNGELHFKDQLDGVDDERHVDGDVADGGNDEDHDTEMCKLLEVPCHVIPNHPCCKHEELLTKAKLPMGNVFKPSTIPAPRPFRTTSLETTTTSTTTTTTDTTTTTTMTSPVNPDEILISMKQIREICRALTISCRMTPDHICCKNSVLDDSPEPEVPESAESADEGQDEDAESSDEEESFDFSKASFTRPASAGATSPPRLPDNRVLNPAQLDRQKFCQSARFSCGSQPDHPCCSNQAPAPATEEAEPNDSFEAEAGDDVGSHEFVDEDSEDLDHFDFSRISSKTTAAAAATTAAGSAAASFQPGRTTGRPEEELPADGPTRFLGGQRRAMKPTDGKVRRPGFEAQKQWKLFNSDTHHFSLIL